MSRTPDAALTRHMYANYLTGKSCAAVAVLFGLSPQTVFDRFRRQRLELRPSSRKRALPFVEFDGERYAPGKDNYFRRTRGSRELLHHAMWRKANGRIKRGWVVHFVDGDRMNVELDNLEALPKCEERKVRPIELKPCLFCGQLMGRRSTGDTPEPPSGYAKRKTCSPACSGNWKRGRPRGTRMGRQ